MTRRYLTGTLAQMRDIRTALATADGLPRRARVVGGPDLLPTTYALGAPGWTDQVSPLPISDGEAAALEVPPEAEKHLGKVVHVNGKAVTIPVAGLVTAENVMPVHVREKIRELRGGTDV